MGGFGIVFECGDQRWNGNAWGWIQDKDELALIPNMMYMPMNDQRNEGNTKEHQRESHGFVRFE